jgi:hypothetical protein
LFGSDSEDEQHPSEVTSTSTASTAPPVTRTNIFGNSFDPETATSSELRAHYYQKAAEAAAFSVLADVHLDRISLLENKVIQLLEQLISAHHHILDDTAYLVETVLETQE